MEKEVKIAGTNGEESLLPTNDQIEQSAESPNMGEDAAIHSEADLREHGNDGHEEQLPDSGEIDYSTFLKKDFVNLVKDLVEGTSGNKSDIILKEIKPLYDRIRNKEKKEALNTFITEGGVKGDFEYKYDDDDIAFDATVVLLKSRKVKLHREQEDQRSQNLQKKQDLLVKLRSLVDGEDSKSGFEEFKSVQKVWKEIGSVSSAQSRGLWANYNALIDRYYDHRSIYFELKELDRKRNLEAKMELAAKAENLAGVARLNDAVKQLNELHHEFKHVGPVPIEEKDALWNRFKAASDAVYARRDAYVKSLQEELLKNLELKNKLIEETVPLIEFTSDRIKEWNKKTKEILELQKKWEQVGGIPRNKSKTVNKIFWTNFKLFFANKSAFFKKLDDEREINLKLKTGLVEQAKSLQESQDWNGTSNQLIQLQKKWKDIGPVPGKLREKIYLEFKAACDHFFELRRSQSEKEGQNQTENLVAKNKICAEILQLAESGNGSLESLREFQDKFNAIGFVPKADMGKIRAAFQHATQKLLATSNDVPKEERDRFVLEMELGDLRNGPDGERKIIQKEQTIRKRISKVEYDLALLKNNMEFFGRSKNAEKYKSEFRVKITEAADHLDQLKSQLKLIKTVY